MASASPIMRRRFGVMQILHADTSAASYADQPRVWEGTQWVQNVTPMTNQNPWGQKHKNSVLLLLGG